MEEIDENVDVDEHTSFLDHVYLECTQRERKPNESIIEQYTKMFESHKFQLEQHKIYRSGKNLTHKQKRSPTTWRDMLKNALSDTATSQTRKWSICTKFQVLSWMTIRKNLNQLNNYQWHELDDLTSGGQSPSLRYQSRNRLKHVTDAWQG